MEVTLCIDIMRHVAVQAFSCVQSELNFALKVPCDEHSMAGKITDYSRYIDAPRVHRSRLVDGSAER
jgi:hypothetical protein